MRISTTALTTAVLAGLTNATPGYEEHLDLTPLPGNALLASFQFRAEQAKRDLVAHDYRVFPRELAQVLEGAGVAEVHLRFAVGRWDEEGWGERPWSGKREGGVGVELWAYLVEGYDGIEKQWRMLTNTLSGLFCASLNFIDETRTTYPKYSFPPTGSHNQTLRLVHGVLPHEVVCTENLTPFVKMLPCKGKAGLASLLDGHRLFDATWQSMAIDVRPVCRDGEKECVVEVEQTVDMVMDIPRAQRPRDNPIPHPPPGDMLPCDMSRPYTDASTCYPIDSQPGQEWTLSNLFGKTLQGSCPLAPADKAPVCVMVPEGRPVTVSGAKYEVGYSPTKRCFIPFEDSQFDMTVGEAPSPETAVMAPKQPPLYVARVLTGHGQQSASVKTTLRNPSPYSVTFIYKESLPWFMRLYLHTLQTTDASTGEAIPHSTTYQAPIDRLRGTHLELKMTIPANTTALLTYHFQKAILRYTEYPPDANRGFDVAAASVHVLGSDGKTVTHEIRTTAMLLYLPTPDFSMPYNVIIFTSTAVALVFGGLHNLLVRRMVLEEEIEEGMFKSKMAKFKKWLRALKGKRD